MTPDIKNQVFPPGNCRELTNLVAAMMGEKSSPGYHPNKVLETMRNSALFRVWFDALPDDLTGIDLSPLYTLAETAYETRELSLRARKWEPDPKNLSDKYNGPIGPDGQADRLLVTRWRNAVEKAKRDHEGRFDADLRTMAEGDVPTALEEAVAKLVALAKDPETGEWDACADARDILATEAAMRLCLSALAEIDEERLHVARETLARRRADATAIANVPGVLS